MPERKITVDPATGLKVGSFAIASLSDGSRAFPALVLPDGGVLDLSTRFADTHSIFDDWASSCELLGQLAANEPPALRFDDLEALPPLAHPNLMCAGANYKTHSAQMLTKNKFNQHNRLPDESDDDFFARNYALMEERGRTGTPFFWTGLHSSLVGATHEVVLPPIGEQPDWELELGVVVGRHARYASLEEARTLVAGYVMVNDIGTVDVFRRTDVPWGYDWVSKHQPTFKPAGPFIVPAEFVDEDELRIHLSVNGETMQDWPANDMIFSVAQFLTYASERVNLQPGDLLILGSPPGNGAHHGRFLKPGDVIKSEITGLGRQRNECVAEDVGGRTPVFGNWTDTD
jgi:2-keto-4-pentenoate hydratase/2-oxohepta-3-ene-1,7-dioic acid hydratase in catechol pathway